MFDCVWYEKITKVLKMSPVNIFYGLLSFKMTFEYIWNIWYVLGHLNTFWYISDDIWRHFLDYYGIFENIKEYLRTFLITFFKNLMFLFFLKINTVNDRIFKSSESQNSFLRRKSRRKRDDNSRLWVREKRAMTTQGRHQKTNRLKLWIFYWRNTRNARDFDQKAKIKSNCFQILNLSNLAIVWK